MKCLLAMVTCLMIPAGELIAQESEFRLTFSGVLAGKLPPDTQFHFWAPFADPPERDTFGIDELPIVLPFSEFEGHHWNILFFSKATRASFSVTLSEDLFDKPRLIDVKLDPPRPAIRPISSGREVKYTARMTQRMQYGDLPCWDRERETLTGSRPPRVTIVALKDGVVVHDQEMEDRCVGSKWYSRVRHEFRYREGETYRMSVTYDSGGVFPTMTTACDFTYHSALHGG